VDVASPAMTRTFAIFRSASSRFAVSTNRDFHSTPITSPCVPTFSEEQASLTQVAVVREHSLVIRRGMELIGRLMQELDAVSTHGNEIAATIDATESDEKRRLAAHRAVSLQARAGVMRDLAHSARLWIQLERQAFRISDDRDRNTVSRIEEMTEEELEASILEDLRILNLSPNPEPKKPKGVPPRGSK
jgi:hypothetical protein